MYLLAPFAVSLEHNFSRGASLPKLDAAPPRASDCVGPSRSLSHVTLLVTGRSGPKLIHQQEETFSVVHGSHFLVPLSDSQHGLGQRPLCPQDPTSKSKAAGLERSLPSLRQPREDWGTGARGAAGRKGRRWFLRVLGSFQSCGKLDFLFFSFGRTSGFERKKSF